MIETTVASLIAIKPVLQQLANVEMAARDSFIVLRLLKNIDKEYEIIESAQHKMLDMYGLKNEEGKLVLNTQGGFTIKEEFAGVFAVEMEQLLKTKLEIEGNKIKLDILDKLQLTPHQLLKMEDFISEE